MKTRPTMILLIAIVALILAPNCSAQSTGKKRAKKQQTKSQQPEKQRSEKQPPLFDVEDEANHKNLQVVLLIGEDRIKDNQYMPLDTALKYGVVRINETGNVRNLTIENLSSEYYVFVNSGDIIKGGRQDRYLANTLVVPPKSGKIPLASFCVEAGRWSRRGGESAEEFSRSRFMASSLEQRRAAQLLMDQGELWKEVAATRSLFSMALYNGVPDPSDRFGVGGVPGGLPGGLPSSNAGGSPALLGSQASPPSPALIIPSENKTQNPVEEMNIAGLLNVLRAADLLSSTSYNGVSNVVRDASARTSSSSLQLALENKELQNMVKQYVDHINGNLSKHNDAIGFAFAINGTITGADVYGRSDLFSELWPKLINAAATEAVAKYDAKKKVQLLKRVDFVDFFTNQKQDHSVRRKLNNETVLTTIKGDKHILFETRNKRAGASWAHRSYLASWE